jgi:hypothetical protein
LFSSIKLEDFKELHKKMKAFVKRKHKELNEVKRRYKVKLELKEKYLKKLDSDIDDTNKLFSAEIKKAQDTLRRDKIKCN